MDFLEVWVFPRKPLKSTFTIILWTYTRYRLIFKLTLNQRGFVLRKVYRTHSLSIKEYFQIDVLIVLIHFTFEESVEQGNLSHYIIFPSNRKPQLCFKVPLLFCLCYCLQYAYASVTLVHININKSKC